MKKTAILRDRYGFLFWLKWIVWFAGSFAASAFLWTLLMKAVFLEIKGPELALTWSVAVFGSWFLLLIPFMRKKEQIWKRLNQDQEAAVDAWLLGMGIFIGLLVLSCFFWSWRMRAQIQAEGFERGWLKLIFATWLFILIPFLVFMYRRADEIFKTAHARQTYVPGYKKNSIDSKKLLISKNISEVLKKIPETLPNAHVVSVVLKSGEKIQHVFIKYRREIAGVYDRESLGFEAGDISAVEAMDPDQLPAYEESRWLRVDSIALDNNSAL